MTEETFTVQMVKQINSETLPSESAEILKEALDQIKPIVEARRRLAEQEQSIQGAIVKLTQVVIELQNDFSAFKTQKNGNAELEREVLSKIKSKLGE
jgi:hypothetical protein